MLARYHIEITTRATEDCFSDIALQTIIDANIGQDKLINLILHPEYHFDNNLFIEAATYLDQQREMVITSLNDGNQRVSRQAFGRIIHGVQDFYAHSNYVALWLNRHDGKDRNHIDPDHIEPLDEGILSNPDLHSGQIYYMREAMSYIPGLSEFAKRISPPDAHAHMNLDDPGKGDLFPYALQVALKHTRHEFEEISQAIEARYGIEGLERFTGRQHSPGHQIQSATNRGGEPDAEK